MTIQIIRAPSGEELVVLPREDYEALVRAAEEAAEDAADVAAYDAAMAENAGRDPLPVEISSHIHKGASLLRAIRLWRGVSQSDLAAATGLSQGFLSDLENRRRKRTPAVGRKLAKALDVPDYWLV